MLFDKVITFDVTDPVPPPKYQAAQIFSAILTNPVYGSISMVKSNNAVKQQCRETTIP